MSNSLSGTQHTLSPSQRPEQTCRGPKCLYEKPQRVFDTKLGILSPSPNIHPGLRQNFLLLLYCVGTTQLVVTCHLRLVITIEKFGRTSLTWRAFGGLESHRPQDRPLFEIPQVQTHPSPPQDSTEDPRETHWNLLWSTRFQDLVGHHTWLSSPVRRTPNSSWGLVDRPQTSVLV